jgi:FkbM family methyltransferase
MHPVPKVLPDDHDAMIRLFMSHLARGPAVTGVVHVGAHQGQEVPYYFDAGISRIVLIEANPEHCAFLRRAFPQVDVIGAAVTDFEGTVDLHVNQSRSGNDESSSILELRELSRIVTTLRTDRTVRVAATSLDTLAASGKLNGCNFLNVDVQGAELLVLAGAKGYVQSVDAILIEVNLIETYAGCAREPEIDATLESAGFTCVERVYHELYEGEHRFPAWGESLYFRN